MRPHLGQSLVAIVVNALAAQRLIERRVKPGRSNQKLDVHSIFASGRWLIVTVCCLYSYAGVEPVHIVA